MGYELSAENEQFLDELVASGVYDSRQAALDAAIVSLRDRFQADDDVPEEHLQAIEHALEQADRGQCRPLTEADRQRWRSIARGEAAPPGRRQK